MKAILISSQTSSPPAAIEPIMKIALSSKIGLIQRSAQPGEHYVDAGYISRSQSSSQQRIRNNQYDRTSYRSGDASRLITVWDNTGSIPNRSTKAVTSPQGLHRPPSQSPSVHSLSFLFSRNNSVPPVRMRMPLLHRQGGRTIGHSMLIMNLTASGTRAPKNRSLQKRLPPTSQRRGRFSLSALVRGHGMRVSRYIGQKKRNLQAIFTGCAANLKRTARWLAGERPQTPRSKSRTSHPA